MKNATLLLSILVSAMLTAVLAIAIQEEFTLPSNFGIQARYVMVPLLSAASVIGSAALKSWRGEPVVVKRGEMTFRMPSFRRPKAPPKSAA